MEITKNISQITNPKLDLKLITVLGLKFDDPKKSIPTELNTEDSNGSWLHTTKGITIRVSEEEPKKIVEFILKPELLAELKITKEKRITKRFGKTTAIEKQRESTFYFYSDQKIVVAWDNADDKLFGIYFGENLIQQTRFRIIDFIDKFYEFKRMAPNYNKWNTRSLKYDKSRLYRLKELESLMIAFDIGTDLLQDYQNRKFMERRTLSDFDPIIKDIEKYALNNDFEKERYKHELERVQSIRFFEMLIQNFMRFSEEMRNILSFNSGVLEAGFVMSRYHINKTQTLINGIDLKQLNEIEDLLGKVLDTKSRVFTKSELIKNYNFPDIDLHSIDMENW